ncbi:MAG TPA: glycosyltransferase [Steroidobacteraceae bacterium]|nr:glycosyltransferase [Steroidobacteraceae bacterium]
MRVVQVTESLEIGGAERVVVTLANSLAARHESSVICLKQLGPLAAELAGVPVSCIGKREGNDPAAILRLARAFEAARADVVHAHDWGCYLDAMAAAWMAGIRVAVQTVHGKYMAYPPGRLAGLKKSLRHMCERRAARRFGNVVCVSDALRAHVAEEIGIGAAQTMTIANGVAVPPLHRNRAPQPGALRLVTVGRLAAVKNYELLIRAFAPLAARWPQLSLTFVGDGPERAGLERLASSLGLAGSVFFLGFRSDIDQLLADSDIFVLTSVSEGIPMSILEAMKCGLPVVATRVGGVPATVADGETGMLVESGDDRALTRALAVLIENPRSAEAMGAAGHARALQKFSVEAMVGAYEAVYRRGRAS